MTKEEILGWILDKNIKCMMVDYKLRPSFDFVGTDLVAYINSELPDLPCMVLTAYPQESLSENLVVKNMIEERGALDSSDIGPFIEKLKQAVAVFDNRLKRHTEEYQDLLIGRKESGLSSKQEERFLYLYKLLRSYGELDEIPIELLRPEIGAKMDQLLNKLDRMLKNDGTEEDE
jgi:hypothetical protein